MAFDYVSIKFMCSLERKKVTKYLSASAYFSVSFFFFLIWFETHCTPLTFTSKKNFSIFWYFLVRDNYEKKNWELIDKKTVQLFSQLLGIRREITKTSMLFIGAFLLHLVVFHVFIMLINKIITVNVDKLFSLLQHFWMMLCFTLKVNVNRWQVFFFSFSAMMFMMAKKEK